MRRPAPRNAPPPPDFVIAGFPKCGTTALYRWLSTHPGIFLADPKEPHTFADDLGDHREVPDLRAYLRLFRRAAPGLLRGEASVWTVHSRVAVPRLIAHRPDVRLIVLIRNPLEFLPSYHSDLRWVCFEEEPDLERAWDLQEERRAGRGVPRACQVPWFLQYRDVARFGGHVERLLATVPRERVRFLFHDDLRQDPRRVYEAALAFLGLEPDDRAEFPRVNASKQSRSTGLARTRAALVRALPRPLVVVGRRTGLERISHRIQEWNSVPRPPAPLEGPFRRRLVDELGDDIDRLGRLVGRDLSRWTEPVPRARRPA